MSLLGAGEIIGGQIIGNIRDRTSNRVAFLSEMVLQISGITLLVVFNERNRFDYLAYIMVFVFGVQDSGLNCLINCILGFEFESKTTPFGVNKFV
jgi:predicted MFS family arabinose efflux permease